MVFCYNCRKTVAHPDNIDGKICCNECGRVIDEDNFSQEPTFTKDASGQSRLSGNYVRTTQSDRTASRQRTLDEAYDGIESMVYALGIDGGDSVIRPALRIYTIALERNFTRGRRKELVQAACLYLHCRVVNKPYLLIDFSEHLRINVYVLGAVFLQLCTMLSLEQNPIVQKPVDPSLFIHKFTDRLCSGRNAQVSRTALQIVASMKRDWMQTGRKPSGLCGAALYISCLSHGLKYSKTEIIRVVHICEATLMKRVIEFENTESGGLTIDEFRMRAQELEKEQRPIEKTAGNGELLCEHKSSGKPHFAHGLCESCYVDFIKLSGGLDGGSEPPAFQRAERERIMAKEAAAESSENLDSFALCSQAEKKNGLLNPDKQRSTNNTSESGVSPSAESDLTGATSQDKVMHDFTNDRMDSGDATVEGPESFSDIDDTEVVTYLVIEEEEKELKKIIWEEMNKEYLEEQAAKEADNLAKKKAEEAYYNNCPEEIRAAKKLADEAHAAVSKFRKEKQQKRAEEIKKMGPAKTATEATKQMLDRKRLSSKVNYAELEKLFNEPVEPENKRRRKEADSNQDDGYLSNIEEEPEIDDNQDAYNENEEEFDYGDDNHFNDFL